MASSRFVTVLVLCAAYNLIDRVNGQSVIGECVNETLILGNDCQTRPQHDSFFKLLEELITTDVALIVLELKIADVNNSVYSHYRFDLVKTDLGQILLTLKSQMEFLTINLPLLSDKVVRQSMQLNPSPPGCLANVTSNETLVKNWLLCGLTREQDSNEKLLIKKLCLAKPYEEPDDWFLFRDTYYNECTDTPIKDSQWIRLNEDNLVILCKRILNFGVTFLSILCVVVVTMYRRLFHTKARLFLCKLHNPQRRICKITKGHDDEPDKVRLSPEKINLPALTFKPLNLMKCECCRVECSGGHQSDHWEHITDEPKLYHLDITGFWFDIENDALISYNSFGMLSLLKAFVEEVSVAVCTWCKGCCCAPRLCTFLHFLLHVLFFLVVTAGILIPVFMLYKQDPFHTLLDGLVSLTIFIVVPISMVATRVTLGFCKGEVIDSIQTIILEVTFFFSAFFVIAILSRVIVILLLGLALQSAPNIYTLVSGAVILVFTNGYYQLRKIHKRYLEFLEMCMKHIMQSVDETKTSNVPVFKNRVVPSNTESEIWPATKGNNQTLFLTMENRFVLYYLPNGESAIDRDFFLDLCKADSNHSPGDLKLTCMIDFVKFIFGGIVVSLIIFVQYIVAKNFDSSLYNQAPSTVFGGLLPILLDSILFPEHKKEENANLTRLLNDMRKQFKKEYRVTDFEMNGKPVACNEDQIGNVWQRICIEKSPNGGCFCLKNSVQEQSIVGRGLEVVEEEVRIGEETSRGRSEGKVSNTGKVEYHRGLVSNPKNLMFQSFETTEENPN